MSCRQELCDSKMKRQKESNFSNIHSCSNYPERNNVEPLSGPDPELEICRFVSHPYLHFNLLPRVATMESGAVANMAADPQHLTIFDGDGDLQLEFGDDASGHKKGSKKRARDAEEPQNPTPVQVYVVCSKTLSRASKPFKTMLYGPFAESKNQQKDPESPWKVNLPDDDPKTFAVLMNIIHNKFTLVPKTMSRDELFKITVLTDKYAMTDVLHPWATSWITPLADIKINKAQFASGDERCLWIAWELGHQELFCCVLKHVLNCCDVNDSGQLVYQTAILQNNPHLVNLGILGKHFRNPIRRRDFYQRSCFMNLLFVVCRLVLICKNKTISPLSVPESLPPNLPSSTAPCRI